MITLHEFIANRDVRNQFLLDGIRSSDDHELDVESMNKSIVDHGRGVLLGPFHHLDEVGVVEPCIAPRRGIWEVHGAVVYASVRNIDYMLVGEQNLTSGSVSSHRPTDVDGIASQTRAVASAYPYDRTIC